MNEKPLHVQQAETLGCKPRFAEAEAYYRKPAGWYCGCDAQCPLQWVPPAGFVAGGLITPELITGGHPFGKSR